MAGLDVCSDDGVNPVSETQVSDSKCGSAGGPVQKNVFSPNGSLCHRDNVPKWSLKHYNKPKIYDI